MVNAMTRKLKKTKMITISSGLLKIELAIVCTVVREKRGGTNQVGGDQTDTDIRQVSQRAQHCEHTCCRPAHGYSFVIISQVKNPLIAHAVAVMARSSELEVFVSSLRQAP